MDFESWEDSVPAPIREDRLWSARAYRMALYAAHRGWNDVVRLHDDGRTRSLGDQLFRALGAISANFAEGYSRSTGMDRARFYEYALGSARESRDWYYKAQCILGPDSTSDQIELLTQIIRLLLVTVARERPSTGLRERRAPRDKAE